MKRNRLLACAEITVISVDAPMQFSTNRAFVEIVPNQSRDGIFITYTFAVFKRRIFEVVAFLFETATKYVHNRSVYIVAHDLCEFHFFTRFARTLGSVHNSFARRFDIIHSHIIASKIDKFPHVIHDFFRYIHLGFTWRLLTRMVV
jgi:hypothetical protein